MFFQDFDQHPSPKYQWINRTCNLVEYVNLSEKARHFVQLEVNGFLQMGISWQWDDSFVYHLQKHTHSHKCSVQWSRTIHSWHQVQLINNESNASQSLFPVGTPCVGTSLLPPTVPAWLPDSRTPRLRAPIATPLRGRRGGSPHMSGPRFPPPHCLFIMF